MAETRYDAIGHDYTSTRQADPRIAGQIWAAIGDADRIVNVGAGAGSYERADRTMVAVEPSAVMINQRPVGAAPAVRAGAEALPFPDDAFDVALASMTVHHWTDLVQGLREMRRVSRRQVVFSFDPSVHDSSWVFNEYVPAALGQAYAAPLEVVVEALGATRVEVIPVPADCTDGFVIAFWRRPHMYLDPSVRASNSAFALLDDADVLPGMARLAADLTDGSWAARHADLLSKA